MKSQLSHRTIVRLLWLSGSALLVLAGIYLARGFYHLLMVTEDASDLRFRWFEVAHILSGDTRMSALANQNRESPLWMPFDGGYPPWSMFNGILLVWPSWPAVRIYYAVIQVVCLAVIGAFVTWYFRKAPPGLRFFLLAGSMAINGICGTLILGQYGLVVVAALCGTLYFAERKKWGTSGLLLGMAMIKPTLAAPVVLPFVAKRRFQPLLVAAGWMALGTLVIWLWTASSMQEMFVNSLAIGMRMGSKGYSAITPLIQLGLQPSASFVIVGFSGFLLGLFTLRGLRKADWLVGFAVSIVIARVFTYHGRYDNVALIFLFLSLFAHAFAARTNLWLWSLSIATGISLWMPARFVEWPDFPMKMLQLTTWLAGMASLLFLQFNDRLTSELRLQRDGDLTDPATDGPEPEQTASLDRGR